MPLNFLKKIREVDLRRVEFILIIAKVFCDLLVFTLTRLSS